jgi:hypothetical protein
VIDADRDDVKKIRAWAIAEHRRHIADLQAKALSTEDLSRIRQWYNAVSDLNPGYLDDSDRELAGRLWNG